MSWNWELRDRFLEAGRLLNYEVTCTWQFYQMKIPDKNIYCYLWHPLNKMDNVRREERKPEWALDYIKSNQDDFHIELDSYEDSIMHLFPELWNDPSTAVICETLLKAQDPEEVAHRRFLDNLKGDDE